MIRANVHTADDAHDVDFDASTWFEQASYEDVCALLRGNCEGEAADDLVFWFQHRHPQIAALLARVDEEDLGALRGDHGFGRVTLEERALGMILSEVEPDFECSVNRGDALRWLEVNRPRWDARPCAPVRHKGRWVG